MAKDPAFLFYSNDFMSGTQFFSDEQVGKYIRLLIAQHQTGHLDEKHMLFICKTYDKDIFQKFSRDTDGKYYNERLENEMIKRKEYAESRAKNRTAKKNISTTYVPHMENENRDINTNVFNKGFFLSDFPKDYKLTDIQKGATIEFIRLQAKKTITDQEISDEWEAFKIDNFDKKEWRQNFEDVLSHFRRSLRIKIINGKDKQSSTSSKSANGKGANQLLNSLKADLSGQ